MQSWEGNEGHRLRASMMLIISALVEFDRDFGQAGIDVNNPEYGTWVARPLHQGISSEYSNDWAAFLHGNPTRAEIFDFARMLARKYGFDVYF